MKGSKEKVVLYFRVSTARQENDSQKPQVSSYLKSLGPHEVLGEFEEKESGKNDNRPELANALKVCKEHDALLIVAKLDRLSRNLSFISNLQDSKVRFRAADMPEANEFVVSIFAALAQQERKMISQRTKAGLAAKKAKGKKLGSANRKIKKAWKLRGKKNSLETRQKNSISFYQSIRDRLESELKGNKSQTEIAETFNAYGLKAMRGGLWCRQGVALAIKKLGLNHKSPLQLRNYQ